MSIENTRSTSGRDHLAGAGAAALSGYGGGNGLAGMRERIESVGGSMQAGPTEQGWLVDLAVPTLEWSR